MLTNNKARLKRRGLALQKERVCKAKRLYVFSPGWENKSIWLRSVTWLLCLCDSALPREDWKELSLSWWRGAHFYEEQVCRLVFVDIQSPLFPPALFSFFLFLPVMRWGEEKHGKSVKAKSPLCRSEPGEQIASAHAWDPAENPASGHMLRRERAINPPISRNEFFCCRIQFHLF